MRVWKIQRIATFDDDELANKLMDIESKKGCKVKEVIYIGENPSKVRLYQILYVEE